MKANTVEVEKPVRPNQSTMERIRAAFQALKTPYFRTTAILSKGRKVDIIHGRQIMPKPWMHKEEQRKVAANLHLYWTDGRTTINWCTVGLKSTSSISTTSPTLTSAHSRHTICTRMLGKLCTLCKHFAHSANTFGHSANTRCTCKLTQSRVVVFECSSFKVRVWLCPIFGWSRFVSVGRR